LHSTNTSTTLASRPPDFVAPTASVYPVATGKAAILRTIAPNIRRVRSLSANSSQQYRRTVQAVRAQLLGAKSPPVQREVRAEECRMLLAASVKDQYRFYEKVVKVKVGVAAILHYARPFPHRQGRELRNVPRRPAPARRSRPEFFACD
jgi:hypothetical protein